MVHLIASAFILAYFHGPLAGEEWLEAVIRFGVLPVVVASGVVMWQLPRWRRARNRRARAAQG